MEWAKNVYRNEEIRRLRKDGFSITHISKALNVCKSMVSYHCRSVRPEKSISHYADTSSANKANAKTWIDRKKNVRTLAELEWKDLRTDPEFMGFLGLYWGEGDKKASYVGIVNNDPGVIVAAISMFRRLHPGANMQVLVRVYPDHDENEARRFWSAILGQKVTITEKQWVGKLHRAHSRRGICSVRFSHWETKIRIMTWLDMWRSELVRAEGIEPTDFRIPNAALDR
jgi:hypothetical protein